MGEVATSGAGFSTDRAGIASSVAFDIGAGWSFGDTAVGGDLPFQIRSEALGG